MPKLLNIVTIILAGLALSSCTNDLKDYYGRPGLMTMRPARLGNTMPDGDDSYSQGFRDGCNTAIGIMGTGPMASTYEPIYYNFDKSLKDPDYYKGRNIGFNYCTYYQDVDPI